MTISANFNKLTTKLASPAGTLGIGLLMAILLALLPGRPSDSFRGAMARLLRPGQLAATKLRRQGTQVASRIRSHFQTAAGVAQTERELQRLRREKEKLTAELAAARSELARAAVGEPDDEAQRLFRARCVPARVLGRQARAFLGRHQMLDVGSSAGIEPDALVVDCPPLIDRGGDAEIRPGELVLAGRRVWGKIVQLGAHTSTVLAVTEPGYRDLVRLADRSGTEGLLEGTGQRLARIRLVEVTRPLSVGDPVFAAADKGVLRRPLLYGRIIRLERPIGAAHWQIWMQPAVAHEPERVDVLRIELNPLRVAGKGSGFRVQGSATNN